MRKSILHAIILLIVFSACNHNDLSRTKQGLEYRIYSGKEGSALRYGVDIRALLKKYYNDSLLATPTDSIVRLIRIDSLYIQPSYAEALVHARSGDSVVTYQRIDTSKLKEGLPGFAKHGNLFINSIKILAVIEDSLLGIIYENEAEVKIHKIDSIIKKRELELEDSTLAAYTKHIPTVKTTHGIYVSNLTRHTRNTRNIKQGDKVIADYKAYTLRNNFIDGSFDSRGRSVHPLSFMVGASEVIPGIDEGIRYFRKGDSGRILIPALYAFGKFGIEGKVKPYENIFYDIYIIDVR